MLQAQHVTNILACMTSQVNTGNLNLKVFICQVGQSARAESLFTRKYWPHNFSSVCQTPGGMLTTLFCSNSFLSFDVAKICQSRWQENITSV